MRRASTLLAAGLLVGTLAGCSDPTPSASDQAASPQSINRADPAVTTFAVTLVEREPEYIELLSAWGECGGGPDCAAEAFTFAEWAREVQTEIRTADTAKLPSLVRDLAVQTSVTLGALGDAVEADDDAGAKVQFDKLEGHLEEWAGYAD